MEQDFNTHEFPVYYGKYGYPYESRYYSRRGDVQNAWGIIKFKITTQIIPQIISSIIATIAVHPIISYMDIRNISTQIAVSQSVPNPNQNPPVQADTDDIAQTQSIIGNYLSERAHLHNMKAKDFLEQIGSMRDSDIGDLLEMAVGELAISFSLDKECGETHYIFASALLKMGDQYSAANNIPKAIEAYKEGLDSFQKAKDYFYYPYTNILFERGKAYSALGNIYKDNDADLAKDYFSKSMEDHKEYIYLHNLFTPPR